MPPTPTPRLRRGEPPGLWSLAAPHGASSCIANETQHDTRGAGGTRIHETRMRPTGPAPAPRSPAKLRGGCRHALCHLGCCLLKLFL